VQSSLTEPHLCLEGDEARHLRTVLRARPGDEVALFNGRGLEAVARVVALLEENVQLEILSCSSPERKARVALTLATAVPKGERFRWLIEKATELGVDCIVPLVTERSVVDPGEGKLDRLRRTIIESSKQCGRNTLMTLEAPVAWREFLSRAGHRSRLLVADRGGQPWSPLLVEGTSALTLAVGPEGGFTPGELALAQEHESLHVSLGPTILRIETAAIALAALAAAG
jgi:16S rRNA (uracil1498-N3)-methyltransferase